MSKQVSLIEEVAVRLQRGDDPKQFAKDLAAFLKDPSVVRAARSHVIDCSVQPMIPDGWEIRPEDQIASRFQGELLWSPDKIRLHLDPGHEGDAYLKGEGLKKKLEGQPVLPANVLDYLLAHPALIPSDWKGKCVFFWGTVYRRADGGACVRCLFCGNRLWDSNAYWLDGGWDRRDPAAVSAS